MRRCAQRRGCFIKLAQMPFFFLSCVGFLVVVVPISKVEVLTVAFDLCRLTPVSKGQGREWYIAWKRKAAKPKRYAWCVSLGAAAGSFTI